MSTRAEFFQSMYPGLSDGEVIDELIKASIYGFEHGPEVVTISAAEGIHYVPYDAEMQKKLPYYGGTYEVCNIPFTDFQIRYQPEQIRIVDSKRILEDTAFLCRKDNDHFLILPSVYGKEKRVLNQNETTLAQQKQQAIKDAFAGWVWKDPQRRTLLVKRYNELFNSTRPREYDGSHIHFVGMNPEINLREHQRNAVAHVLYCPLQRI